MITRFGKQTFGAVALAGAVVFAQAEKLARSSDGTCQVSVPAAWTIGALPSTATSADNKQSVTVTSPKMIASFDELKQLAHRTYAESKVTVDSASELEMQGKAINGKPDVYRAIPAGAGKFCIAEVIYTSGTADDARKIVATLKPATK